MTDWAATAEFGCWLVTGADPCRDSLESESTCIGVGFDADPDAGVDADVADVICVGVNVDVDEDEVGTALQSHPMDFRLGV